MMDRASLFTEIVHCYLPKLYILIYQGCTLLFTENCTLLFTDYKTICHYFFPELRIISPVFFGFGWQIKMY